jgi:transposase
VVSVDSVDSVDSVGKDGTPSWWVVCCPRQPNHQLAIAQGDAAYRGHDLADWCKAVGDWELEVVQRTPGTRGLAVQPKRWVVERTFSWIGRNRRMRKDCERKVQTSETLIEVAMIRLLVARLGRKRV